MEQALSVLHDNERLCLLNLDTLRLEKCEDNIVYLIFNRKSHTNNLLDDLFISDYLKAIALLKNEVYQGVVLCSEKQHFFSGGDFDALLALNPDDKAAIFTQLTDFKLAMRWLETTGKPVVCCLNGAALGSGWEIALGSHYRVALNNDVLLGSPEVTYGLMPSAGGIVRLTRLLGFQLANNYLIKGKLFDAHEGKQIGVVDSIASKPSELLSLAIDFIKTNNGAIFQSFDKADYQCPSGRINSKDMLNFQMSMPALLKKRTRGLAPAAESILSVMLESLEVDIDTALGIESRYFVGVVTGPIAKNKMSLYWHKMSQIKSGKSRPQTPSPRVFKQVGIIGAGMMGAGIAYTLASHGIHVVLQDVSLEKAVFAKSYTATILGNSKLSDAQKRKILTNIQPTRSLTDLSHCEVVIEAVFENSTVKAALYNELQSIIQADTIIASNTSTIPITSLASHTLKPNNFIGMHFFSPVDKMQLVEIINGEHTSDETTAAIYDLALQIAKVPIVVNDGRGFFTSRVFMSYVHEGLRLLAEGVDPVLIENGAQLAGYPVGPLALIDEVSVTLLDKVRQQTTSDLKTVENKQSEQVDRVLDFMLNESRLGKANGAGFYDYTNPAKKTLWDGLIDFRHVNKAIPIEDIQNRFLFGQVMESLRAVDENIITSQCDADIGSVLGLGFPDWTGGVLNYIDHIGIESFKQRASYLAAQYGTQFIMPPVKQSWLSFKTE